MNQFEAESKHRHKLEELVVTNESKRANKGQYMYFLGVMVMIGSAIYFFNVDQDLGGSIIGSFGIIGFLIDKLRWSSKKND